MKKLFDAMGDYTATIWEKPEESLMFIQTNIIRLKSPSYIGLCLNAFKIEGAVIPTTMKTAKALWDDAINQCSSMDDVMKLAINICSCFFTQPHRTSQWNKFLDRIGNTHDIENHIKEYLFLSYKYRKNVLDNMSSGRANRTVRKFLSSCEELKAICNDKAANESESTYVKSNDDVISNLAASFAKHESENLKSFGRLHYHKDSINSLMFSEFAPKKATKKKDHSSSEVSKKSDIEGKQSASDKSDANEEAKNVLISSFYDALVNLGLIGYKNCTSPYISVLERELYNVDNDNSDNVPHIDTVEFLNSFSLDMINLEKLDTSDRALSKYIIERLANTNFMYSLCNLIKNTTDSHFKKAIVEVAKFLVLYPLVEYRICVIEELQNLIDSYNKDFAGHLYAQLLTESPNKLLDLLSDDELYQLYNSMDENAKALITKRLKDVLLNTTREERRNILDTFSGTTLAALGKKLLGNRNITEKELLVSNIIGLPLPDFAEAVLDICPSQDINPIELVSVNQLLGLLKELPKKTLRFLLATFECKYKKVLFNRLKNKPFNGAKKSLGQKDMMVKPASTNLLRITWEYMPEEFLAIILYHSVVYFPVLTYVFHACLAVRMKGDISSPTDGFDNKMGNMQFKDIDALFSIEEKEIKINRNKTRAEKAKSRIRYQLIPRVKPPDIDDNLNRVMFDVYSIYYESRTGSDIDPIDLTDHYLSFYYTPKAHKDKEPCDPIDWRETWYAHWLPESDDPFMNIPSTNSEGIIGGFNDLKWRTNSNGGLVMKAMTSILHLKYHDAIDTCLKTFVQDWYPSISYLEEDASTRFRPDTVDPYKSLENSRRPPFRFIY